MFADFRSRNHRGKIEDRTKSKAGTRLVPLFRSAEETLLARQLRLSLGQNPRTDPTPDSLVFSSAVGTPFDPEGWYRREWTPAVEAAGGPAFHFHDLRHYAATRLDEQGMAGKLRTEIIGHANESITNTVYTHISRERISAAASEFDPLTA